MAAFQAPFPATRRHAPSHVLPRTRTLPSPIAQLCMAAMATINSSSSNLSSTISTIVGLALDNVLPTASHGYLAMRPTHHPGRISERLLSLVHVYLSGSPRTSVAPPLVLQEPLCTTDSIGML